MVPKFGWAEKGSSQLNESSVRKIYLIGLVISHEFRIYTVDCPDRTSSWYVHKFVTWGILTFQIPENNK